MKLFKLYPSVKSTKGFKRSLIFDTYTGKYSTIPNTFNEILPLLLEEDYYKVVENYENQRTVIDEYYQFLVSNGYGFFDNDVNSNLNSSSGDVLEPFHYTTLIIDYDRNSKFDLSSAIDKLNSISIKAFQLRCFDELPIEVIADCISKVYLSSIKSMEIIAKYSEGITEEQWINLFNNSGKVLSITIHSSPINRILDGEGYLLQTVNIISSEQNCGNISEKYFTVNNKAYLNSKTCNSCLNKKLSFSKEGKVKNCPSLPESYGNFDEVNLLQLLDNASFTSKWKITKDQVSICKDCEFRDICTDCRAYTLDDSNPFAKPKKCGYDPYQAKWADTIQSDLL